MREVSVRPKGEQEHDANSLPEVPHVEQTHDMVAQLMVDPC